MLHYCQYEGCDASFNRAWKLKSHYYKHQGDPQYKCEVPECGKKYYTSSHLKRHIVSKHNQTQQLDTIFFCEVDKCNLTFHSRWSLKRHLNSHKYQCDMCEKHFSNLKLFTNHLTHHSTIPLFHCKYCKQGFKNRQEFSKHERQHVTYKCAEEHCEGIFFRYNEYRRHLKIAHPKTYICEHCNFMCSKREQIISHLFRLCFKNLKNEFKCTVTGCNKCFQYKRNLTSHINKSHGQPLFMCPFPDCQKQLRYKRTYEHHLSLHEQNKIKLPKEQKVRINYSKKLALKLMEHM